MTEHDREALIAEEHWDVTRHRQSEEGLRERERFLNTVTGAARVGLVVVEPGYRYRFANEAYAEILNLSTDRIVGRHVYEVIPEAWQQIQPRLDRALAGERVSYELTLPPRHEGGVDGAYTVFYEPHVDGDGQRTVVVVVVDITKRKQAEEALRQSHERYELVLAGAETAIWDWDVPRHKVGFSLGWKTMRGFAEHEVSDSEEEWSRGIHPDDAPRVMAAVQRHFNGDTPFFAEEYRVRRKDGSWMWIADRALALRNADGQIVRMAGAGVDITERKEAEEALRRSEEQLELISNTVPALISYVDEECRYVTCNDAYTKWFGLSRRDIIGRSMKDVLGEEAWTAIGPRMAEALAGRTVDYEAEARYRYGGTRWIHAVYTPHRNAEGRVVGVVVMVTDSTARKHTEEALQRSEALYRAIGESIDYGVWVCAPDGRNTYASESFLKLVGLTQAQCSDFGWGQVLHPDDVHRTISAWEECVRTGGTWDIKHRFRGADGRWHHILARGVPVKDDRGHVVCWAGINLDISDLKRAEDDLRESEERLRVLAAQLERLVDERTQELVQSQERLRALATELNLTEQRERKRLATELHDHLQQLLVLGKLKLGQGRRLAQPLPDCADIINQTDDVLTEALTYTRSLVAELSPPVLHDLGLPAALKWLGEQMKRHELAVRVDVANEPVCLPDHQAMLLFQSVRELLINAAKHAESGTATVSLDQQHDELRIHVRDGGRGFDVGAAGAAVNSAAGTSKFGLFSIRERMRALGGQLHLESSPGQGTTATLAMPLTGSNSKVEDSPSSVEPEFPEPDHSRSNARPSFMPSTKVRVLLVDDHAMMRQGLRSVLESYADIEVVGEAWNGDEAVSSVERHQPAVVIMDINMPRKNGIEATAEIKASYPDIKVIGLSVNASGETQSAMIDAGASVLLTKEAAVEELYRTIQDVLQR